MEYIAASIYCNVGHVSTDAVLEKFRIIREPNLTTLDESKILQSLKKISERHPEWEYKSVCDMKVNMAGKKRARRPIASSVASSDALHDASADAS